MINPVKHTSLQESLNFLWNHEIKFSVLREKLIPKKTFDCKERSLFGKQTNECRNSTTLREEILANDVIRQICGNLAEFILAI